MFFAVSPLNIFDTELKRIAESAKSTSPVIDVADNESEYVLTMDVPGVTINDLKVQLNHDSLELSCIKESSNKNQEDQSSLVFQKSIKFNPDSVFIERTLAHLDSGVLTLKVPKVPARSIEILSDEVSALEIEKATNSTDHKVIDIDVPGIKQCDLKVTLLPDGIVDVSGSRSIKASSGQTTTTYNISKCINIDRKVVDIKSMKCVLSNGVLSLMAPLKPKPEPLSIVVQQNETHQVEEKPLSDCFHFEVDVPGVKSSDIIVQLIDDATMLKITATRSSVTNSKLMTINRVVTFDSEKFDPLKITATVGYGVLTVTAPKVERPKQFLAISNDNKIKES